MLTDGIDPDKMEGSTLMRLNILRGVENIVDIRARMYGNQTHKLDITIEVDARMDVGESQLSYHIDKHRGSTSLGKFLAFIVRTFMLEPVGKGTYYDIGSF